MRAIFFGSPDFAVPCLDALHEVAGVAAVITQPDRPAGRGMSLKPPAVKTRALALGLEVLQPRKVRTPAFAEQLRNYDADVGVVVAYGRILPRAVLEAPRLGCVNVHASLLPRWRGAAPIQWSIVHGDDETGVTLMQMDEGMDTGAILTSSTTPIAREDTARTLSDRLSTMGADLLRIELPRFVRGELAPEPQREDQSTMAPLLKKTDGRIDWRWPASQVDRLIRGMNPWPGAFAERAGRVVKVHKAKPLTLEPDSASPGQVIATESEGILVACGEGVLMITELQESGRKRVSGRAFVAGRGIEQGDSFSSEGTVE